MLFLLILFIYALLPNPSIQYIIGADIVYRPPIRKNVNSKNEAGISDKIMGPNININKLATMITIKKYLITV